MAIDQQEGVDERVVSTEDRLCANGNEVNVGSFVNEHRGCECARRSIRLHVEGLKEGIGCVPMDGTCRSS